MKHFCGLILMQIILSKQDIEDILQKKFNMIAGTWRDDGTYVFDTVLEKLVNDEDYSKSIKISNSLLTPQKTYQQIYTSNGTGLMDGINSLFTNKKK
jgi:hypothetical protein